MSWLNLNAHALTLAESRTKRMWVDTCGNYVWIHTHYAPPIEACAEGMETKCVSAAIPITALSKWKTLHLRWIKVSFPGGSKRSMFDRFHRSRTMCLLPPSPPDTLCSIQTPFESVFRLPALAPPSSWPPDRNLTDKFGNLCKFGNLILERKTVDTSVVLTKESLTIYVIKKFIYEVIYVWAKCFKRVENYSFVSFESFRAPIIIV